MRMECSATEDSSRDESRRDNGVQTVALGKMTLRREEVRKQESKERRVRKSQVRWRLWLRGWLQISTEGFPGGCLQLTDHTLRGWRSEREDKDLTSLSFPLNPLFSLPVCLLLSLKGLRLTCWPIRSSPYRAGFCCIYLCFLPSPSIHLSFIPIFPLSCHPAPSPVLFGIHLFGPVIRQHKSAASPSASVISCA